MGVGNLICAVCQPLQHGKSPSSCPTVDKRVRPRTLPNGLFVCSMAFFLGPRWICSWSHHPVPSHSSSQFTTLEWGFPSLPCVCLPCHSLWSFICRSCSDSSQVFRGNFSINRYRLDVSMRRWGQGLPTSPPCTRTLCSTLVRCMCVPGFCS